MPFCRVSKEARNVIVVVFTCDVVRVTASITYCSVCAVHVAGADDVRALYHMQPRCGVRSALCTVYRSAPHCSPENEMRVAYLVHVKKIQDRNTMFVAPLDADRSPITDVTVVFLYCTRRCSDSTL